MYNFLGQLARIYPVMIFMGFTIVAISFVIGAVNADNASDYFSEDKITREITLTDDFQDIKTIDLWMPAFKFLGLGFILSGIVMALRVILDNLRNVGYDALPREHHHRVPQPPSFWPLMPTFMMTGLMIFIAALILAIVQADNASDVFAHPLPEVDRGYSADGEDLIEPLKDIQATEAWLVPLKFFAVSTELVAIMLGLYSIVWVLNRQTDVLDKVFAEEKARVGQATD